MRMNSAGVSCIHEWALILFRISYCLVATRYMNIRVSITSENLPEEIIFITEIDLDVI